MKKNKKNNRKIIIVTLVILIIFGFSFATYIYILENRKDKTSSQNEVVIPNNIAPMVDEETCG